MKIAIATQKFSEASRHAGQTRILAGEALPETRFDITTTLCKLRDLFSRY
jgi:hypothetical protein